MPEACVLAGVDSTHVTAVRNHILERLESNVPARESFLSAETRVRPDCPSAQSAFYVKVIATIHSNKIR